jgi:hypothetical protein
MKLNPQRRIGLVVAIVFVIGALALVFGKGENRYRWDENYMATREDPYSTHVIAGLLEARGAKDGFTMLTDSMALPGSGGNNYVFIGEGLWLDSLETIRLREFVRAGNTAFISSRTLPLELIYPMYEAISCGTYWEDYFALTDSLARVSLPAAGKRQEKALDLRFRYRNETRLYRWQYISQNYICQADSGLTDLGYLSGNLPNYVHLPYGKGRFLFHTTPMAFTNLAMLEEEGLAYAEGVFAYLEDGPIFWDEWVKVSEDLARRSNPSYTPPERRLDETSPLQFVLQDPALTWAWYLLLGLGLAHLLFRTKRRQRILQISAAHTNTSLEFLDTLSRLYVLQKDHKGIALLQMRLFMAHVHRHYDLPGHEFDEAFVLKLARHSRAPEELLNSLLAKYRQVKRARSINEAELLDFHRTLEAFYRMPASG